MGKRLYVGNLPYDADEAAIRAAFSEVAGTVERVHIPLDRETQRPRGFAFVEMASDEEAQKAVEKVNEAILGTRTLRVSVAEDRRPGGAGGGFSGGARPERRDGPAPRGDAGGDGQARTHRFRPDAKPSHQRERDRARRGQSQSQGRQRRDGGGKERGGGGGKRFDEDGFE